jgi:uncharacterized protein (TIGR03435 family)
MTDRILRNANRLLLAILLFAVAAPLARAQVDNTKLPEFEVATIKPADPNGRVVGLFTYPGGRILCTQCPLQYLIMEAFNVQMFQVAGGPNWKSFGSGTSFDVEAKPPSSSQSSKSNPASFKEHPNDEQRQMLQALLIDRFQLKFHREAKEGSVYILGKNGSPLRLQAPQTKDAFYGCNATQGNLIGWNVSMPQLAVCLSGYLHRPILDQTGVQGSFDLEAPRVALSNDPESDSMSSIFDSLQRIGLKLTSGKGPVETIVIDSVQKPSEN